MPAGSIATAADGSWNTDAATGAVLTSDGTTCTPYQLLNCSDNSPTMIGLPDDKNPDNAAKGDTVLNADDSTCYKVGCRTCGLTPVSANASKQTGCDADACAGVLYAIAPCCGGSATLGLTLAQFPAGASVGSTVTDDTNCWTIGSITGGLTPWTDASPTLVDGDCTADACPSCCDTCPDDLPTSVTVSFHVKVAVQPIGLYDCETLVNIGVFNYMEGDVVLTIPLGTDCPTPDYAPATVVSDSSGYFTVGDTVEVELTTVGSGFCTWNIGDVFGGFRESPTSLSNSIPYPVGSYEPGQGYSTTPPPPFDSSIYELIQCATGITVS